MVGNAAGRRGQVKIVTKHVALELRAVHSTELTTTSCDTQQRNSALRLVTTFRLPPIGDFENCILICYVI